MQPEPIAVLGDGLTGLSVSPISGRTHHYHKQGYMFRGLCTFGESQGLTTQVLLELKKRQMSSLKQARDYYEPMLSASLNQRVIKLRFRSVAYAAWQIDPSSGLDIVDDRITGVPPLQISPHLGHIFLSSIISERFRQGNRPSGIDDESVDAFLTKRFGATFARIFGSAQVHGVQTADSRKVSVHAVSPALWEAEEHGHGSVLLGRAHTPKKPQSSQDTSYELGDLQDKTHRSSGV
ncbi:hypothetical protein J3R82DRAFT_5147 [Butyriboletus roseoflavus]|nr:hypothetical protein J3R82DRAFT_5147 [Butyriboletus roseoflavus]